MNVSSLYRTNRGRLQLMDPRFLVHALSAIAVAVALSHVSQQRVNAAASDEFMRRPNILLMMTDDI
jgi:hypothetical protein